MPLAMGEMGSDWCQATSPRAFMVIDDKGREEHRLKLQLGKKKRRRRVEVSSVQSVCFSWTGLTDLLDRSDRSSFLYFETVIIRTLISFVDMRIVMCATLYYAPFKFV